MDNAQIAKLLQNNLGQLGQLAKEGKLNQQQILQVRLTCLKPALSWVRTFNT